MTNSLSSLSAVMEWESWGLVGSQMTSGQPQQTVCVWVTDLIHCPPLHFHWYCRPQWQSCVCVCVCMCVHFPIWSSSHLAVSCVCPVNRSSLSVPPKRPLSLYYFPSLSVSLSHPPAFLSCWDDHCVCIPLAFLLHHVDLLCSDSAKPNFWTHMTETKTQSCTTNLLLYLRTTFHVSLQGPRLKKEHF